MRVQESIEIQRPPEDVYDFMTDVRNIVKCSGAITEVRDAPERPVVVGDSYTTVARVMGRTIETSHKVTAAQRPERLEMSGKSGSMNLRVEITFEPTDSGTLVTQVGDGEASGVLRFASSVIERTIRQQIRSDLEKLKAIMEQEQGT
jgi:carbon monoxide dehydrogenase subunit G